jgi:hypothetical protein
LVLKSEVAKFVKSYSFSETLVNLEVKLRFVSRNKTAAYLLLNESEVSRYINIMNMQNNHFLALRRRKEKIQSRKKVIRVNREISLDLAI